MQEAKSIIVTGGTGLIGRQLCRKLLERGYHITLLSHSKKTKTDFQIIYWNEIQKKTNLDILLSATYIIHLAGAGIAAKRWTRKRKQKIVSSRIKTAQAIFEAIKGQKNQLKAFISASAIGYYGTITSERIYHEEDQPADDFLGQTCQQWENTVDDFKRIGIRTVKVRTGVVLEREGGALGKLILPVKFGLVPILGNGNQYIPWIHIDDLCNIYIKAVEDETMDGAYNAVAPDHVRFKYFMTALAGILHKSYLRIYISAIMVKLVFGKMSEMLLEGSRISSHRLVKSAGFNFHFPDLQGALESLFDK